MAALSPQPGDFAAVTMGGGLGRAIALGEWLDGGGFARWEHALVYIGDGQCLQAEPGGANVITRGVLPGDIWSSGVIGIPAPARLAVPEVSAQLEGTPYSALDYFALAAHRLHIWAPGLKRRIGDSGHLICSQLVDQFMLDIGVHLFADGRWPGYVTPQDLGSLLRAKGAQVIPPPEGKP